MGGGNAQKSATARARKQEDSKGEGGGGGKDGMAKRGGDTGAKLAAAQAGKDAKAAAKLETEMLGYLFASASGFLSKAITIYMDEHVGRDVLLQFFQALNASCPFLILNDYRLAKQGSALRRAEVLEALAKSL